MYMYISQNLMLIHFLPIFDSNKANVGTKHFRKKTCETQLEANKISGNSCTRTKCSLRAHCVCDGLMSLTMLNSGAICNLKCFYNEQCKRNSVLCCNKLK